ncbi:MAG: VanW family protein [Clostridia bacterium]|nr:VanW family protein [Clostridia bacterium]
MQSAQAMSSPNPYGFSPKMQLVSSFSTDFSTSKEERAHNVALASSNFCWLVVKKGETLSFNTVVGARSEERGYKNAKVIVNGEYTEGVGGGVCQVSTTLYNAWIRAGMSAKSAKSHSLPSSYCGLSQDATVSEFIDLVLLNDSDYDVIVNGYTKNKKVYFDVYGHPLPYKINLRSEITEVLQPPLPLVEWSEELTGEVQRDADGEYTVTQKSAVGYKSRAIIEYVKDGKVIFQKELRKDNYLPVQGKIIRKKQSQDDQIKDSQDKDFPWFDKIYQPSAIGA